MGDSRQARIGFIGAGSHATSQLYPSLVQVASAKLVAVCDLDATKAERNAKRFGADRWYTDVDTMLDREKLDGVCICGHPDMHRDVGLQVLRRKLPIFVEKPSALTARDAQKLADAAARARAWGMVAFMKRHAPGYLLATDIMSAPQFGGLQQLHLQFTQGPYPDLWGFEAAQAFLVGQVVHIFDLTRFLGGGVASVFARLRVSSHNCFGYAITIEFVSGAVGTLTLNTLDHVLPWRDITERVHASGVGESLVVESMEFVTHYPAKDWRPESRQEFGIPLRAWHPNFLATMRGKNLAGYEGELEHFAQCLLAGRPASASLQDGVEALRLGEAVWKSAQTDRPVSLTDARPRRGPHRPITPAGR
jgi:myo-inositol 2-dehydrogenase/D-chiro-inositol 1-dehydrogenase